MPGLGAILWFALAVDVVVTLALLLYLDLRLHALKQTGDLPPSTPRLFGVSRGSSSVGQSIDLPLLYSRRYREIDGHTRRFVPVVRVALTLIPILLVLAVLA